MFLLLSCSCLCPNNWSQVISRELRCCWCSADRRCTNYNWLSQCYCLIKCDLYYRFWGSSTTMIVETSQLSLTDKLRKMNRVLTGLHSGDCQCRRLIIDAQFTAPWWNPNKIINTLRDEQNAPHFADEISLNFFYFDSNMAEMCSL